MTKKEAVREGYTKITLRITKKDLRESNIFLTTDCPITRALRRAGYKDLQDGGNKLLQDFKGEVPTIFYKGIFTKVVWNKKGFQWTFYAKLD